jgi:hypothetical protein
MKSQQLKEQSLLHLLSQNNFIIPEIQREYVWGHNVGVLSRFLDSLVEKRGLVCNHCGNPIKNTKINIGFLYTYKPSYVIYNHERYLDENIIDGQQRFTTLILLLFYYAIKENRTEDFKDVIRIESDIEMAFDYKVRNLTHMFLLQLVNKINNIDELELIFEGKSVWLLNDFKSDATISSMIKALQIIHKKFVTNENMFFDYILNNVKFYHFRTEATNQGEELYITMNARGEALSKNEENKAVLMLDNASLVEFGEKWENWQDFFWKNRDKNDPNSNADIGFNEFLRWIQIIEMTLSDSEVDTQEDEKISDDSLTKEIVTLIQGENINLKKEYFPIHKIEKYFEALKYLYENYYFNADYKSKYDENLDCRIIKKSYLHPKNKTIDQLESFEFIPILFYVYKMQSTKKTIKNQNIFRLLRFLNNLRKDITIRKTINKQVINAIKLVDLLLESDDDIAKITLTSNKKISRTLLTSEENFKFKIYLEFNNREEIESNFWLSENNKILNGKIAPLIQYSYCSNELKSEFIFESNYEKFNAYKFNVEGYKFLFRNFLKLTEEREDLSYNIWGSMLLTSYYKVKDYNQILKTVTCLNSEKFHLIRNKCFLNKIDEVSNFDSAKNYFQSLFTDFLKNYHSIEDLSKENNFKNQLYAYYISLVNNEIWNFDKGKNFGVYLYPKDFNSFFENGVRFQHYKLKWVGSDYNYFDDSKSKIEKFYKEIFKSI